MRRRYREAPGIYHATFGFGTAPYRRRSKSMQGRGATLGKVMDAAHRLVGELKLRMLPYGIKLRDVHALAMARAELAAIQVGARRPAEVQAPSFGDPQDLFEFDGRRDSIGYLAYCLRYCFVHGAVLKQALPDPTLRCFDLPLQLFLGYHYCRGSMAEHVVALEETMGWTDLSELQPGKGHIFGNWQAPMLRERPVDLFWNAASFGEMEPQVVRHYLDQAAGQASWIYLMQARHGKERGRRRGGVERPQTFEDYSGYLPGHILRHERLAQGALKPYRESGGYFEAVWEREPAA